MMTMTRRNFLAVVAGASALPFAPKAAALLPMGRSIPETVVYVEDELIGFNFARGVFQNFSISGKVWSETPMLQPATMAAIVEADVALVRASLVQP